MADLFCTFSDFRFLATNYDLPLFLPPNRYYSSPLHSHRSRISIIKRRPLHLSPFSVTSSPTPSSSELDVISTHEHHDGSLIFRFGDPSEVAKNIEMEESKTVGEEIEGENKDVSSVLEVVEGDNETEVMAKKADSEVTASSSIETADYTDSIVSSSQTAVVGESGSCEKLLEGSSDTDTQLPVLNSSEEVEGYSPPDLGIETVENVDEILSEKYEDSSPVDSVIDDGSKVESDVGTVALSEKETADATSALKETEAASAVDIEQTENVEGGVNEECVDFPVDASILDKNSEMVNNVRTVALSEKETADVTSAVKDMEAASAVDIEQTENVEGSVNEECVDSPVDASILNKNSEMVNNVRTVALSEKETGDIPATDIDAEQTGKEEEGLDEHEGSATENADKSPEVENYAIIVGNSEEETGEVTSITEENIDVPENGVLQASLETTTDVSPISEQQSVENEDDTENFDRNLAYQIEEVNFEADTGTVPIGKSSESDLNDITAFETQNVTGDDNASGTSDAEVNSPSTEAVMNWSIGSEDMASGSKSSVLNGTVGYLSEKEMIQVVTVPLEDDSILEEETGIETVEDSREDDDASENIKEGADLVEASVHEAETESTPASVLDSEMSMANFVISSGAALLPHPSKELTGGEDAYFIAGETWLGVADGVGQWSLEGTTPGVFAQELISNCERLISIDNGDSINNPMELLNLSLSETHSPGSSSVLIAQLDGQAFHVANVGDSGFIIIRHGAIYKRSSPMHHIFHFPIQIQRGDDPSSLAESYRVDLEEEDVIIISTDGLLDNLYDQEISSIVMKSLAADKKLEEVAVLLAMKAQEIGSSAAVRTPFGDDAQAAGFVGYSGGKLDDVAIIVSVVQRR